MSDCPVGHGGRRQLIELAVFLSLLLPMLLPLAGTDISAVPFTQVALATILHEVALTALIAYFLWSQGTPLAAIGWTRRHVGKDVVLGVLLFAAMLVVLAVLAWAFDQVGPSPSRPSQLAEPRSGAELGLALLLVVVAAVAEETIFRGYLILRLRSLTHSTPLAVVISTLLFAAGHAYEGTAGVIAVAVLGAVFALVYLWRRSIVAPVVVHFLQDFWSVVLVPWIEASR